MSNDEKRDFYVYVIKRPWDGIPCYIGKGRGNRMYKHNLHGERHPNRRLASIYKRANEMGMRVRAEVVARGMRESEAFSLEIKLIGRIGRGRKGPLCNKTDGGDGQSGATRSAAVRARHSAFLKELYANNPSLREKVSAGTKNGLARSGARLKMSAAMTERMKDSCEREKLSALSTAAWADPEKRRKQSETLRNRYASDTEFREKVRQALVAQWSDPKIRESRLSATRAMAHPDVVARRIESIRRTKSTVESKMKASRAATLTQARIKRDPERYARMIAKRSASMKAALAAKRAANRECSL